MIRLSLNPSIIKKLNFNKKNETLEIEFKRHIKTAQCINIPLSILQDYIASLKNDDIMEVEDQFPSTLKIVHSNFKLALN
ncbi:hypothetical protein [Algibacter sp.]|uniref:hypothetical protein n=1 Tax=Algibacter sp. TaxID=1872428 RepID=UPI003C761552